MTDSEIRLYIGKISVNCICSLTILASYLDSLESSEVDVRIIQDAAKDIAGIVDSVMKMN